MDYNNPYESLKIPYLDDSAEYQPLSETRISASSHESIFIFTAQADGYWIYGYQVYWANGQTSLRKPSKTFGLFKSERDARLHCIGFMKAYIDHFLPETAVNLRTAERQYLKPILPFD